MWNRLNLQIKLLWLLLVAFFLISYALYLIVKLNKLFNHVTDSQRDQFQTETQAGQETITRKETQGEGSTSQRE